MKRQVFCATHNEVMLRSTLDAFNGDPDALRVFRMDRLPDGSIDAVKYSYDEFQRSEAAGLNSATKSSIA
jgi:hypothetical protein